MEELRLGIFVVPTFALTFVILLYIHFAGKVRDKKNYRNYIIGVATVAFLLNFIWELAQGPLYKGFEYDVQHISFCALASIADMLMVLILLFGFGLIYRDVFWINYLSPTRILILVMAGTVGAIIAEMWYTSRGDWGYAEMMPIITWVKVGLSPVLQFAVLPLLIFLTCKKCKRREHGNLKSG
tara:strand:+ start:6470 stop:7018 length:549 start_codon:yes stop_codon:yes gene_type:complete